MSLPTIDFPAEKIKLNLIYENKLKLQNIENHAFNSTVPSKVKEVYRSLFFPKAPETRPYIFASLVLTLDGKLGFEGDTRSGLISKGNRLDPYGGLADLWMVNLLRTYADGVIFGSKTLHLESNITGHIYDIDLVESRKSILKKNMRIPWNILISRNGENLPFDHKVFTLPEIPLCMITTTLGAEKIVSHLNHDFITLNSSLKQEDLNPLYLKNLINKHEKACIVMIAEKDGKVDVLQALPILKQIGIEHLLVESPTHMYHLMADQVLDEAFINYSCLYAGGQLALGSQIPFQMDTYPAVELLSIHMHSPHFFYTRQQFEYLEST